MLNHKVKINRLKIKKLQKLTILNKKTHKKNYYNINKNLQI